MNKKSKLSLSALWALSIVLWSGTGLEAVAKRANPFFAGLEKVKVDVSVSDDVKRQMKSIGAPDSQLGSELRGLTDKKLSESGISTGGSDQGPKLSVLVDIDMSNDEFTVTATYSDLVSLVRQPDIKFESKLWSRKGHPSGDEAGPIKDTLDLLLDQFIAERVAEIQPKGK